MTAAELIRALSTVHPDTPVQLSEGVLDAIEWRYGHRCPLTGREQTPGAIIIHVGER